MPPARRAAVGVQQARAGVPTLPVPRRARTQTLRSTRHTLPARRLPRWVRCARQRPQNRRRSGRPRGSRAPASRQSRRVTGPRWPCASSSWRHRGRRSAHRPRRSRRARWPGAKDRGTAIAAGPGCECGASARGSAGPAGERRSAARAAGASPGKEGEGWHTWKRGGGVERAGDGAGPTPRPDPMADYT
eukprot:scaffold1691_cov107-Isochrysis_galbana.AAC.18